MLVILGDLDSPKVESKIIEQITEIPKLPSGAIEVVRKTNFAIFFEVAKHPQNPKQFAIRSTAYNLKSIILNQFVMMYGLPQGFHLQAQPQNSNTLEPGKSIFQTLMIQSNVDTPLQMKIQISYLYGSQPLVEYGEVNSSIFK